MWTKEEKKEYAHLYYLKNRNKKGKKESDRLYYLKNKEKILLRTREYALTHKEERRKRVREWNIRNHDRKLAVAKAWRYKTRKKVIEHYGGKCKCCGESKFEFLAIDHINGEGLKDRKCLGKTYYLNGVAFYRYIINNNYPDKYRLLCHNCNMSLGFYGYCPHK